MRVLFLADSHLGTDLPTNARVTRRRRGLDFLANHAAALAPALRGEVDLVVHGGDVFDIPRVPVGVARLAYDPLLRVADAGVPVFIVPGNHERSVLPHSHLLAHPRVHVFDRARTFGVDVNGVRCALSGFPYERRAVRQTFRSLLERTGWRSHDADVRLLCVHHCIEGATVGPGDYVFRSNPDVIRAAELPGEFDAVLSGHIHRHQVLTRDLTGRPLAVPVLYPGSVERTATAEIGETKGYLLLTFGGGLQWQFVPLPARPMLVRRVDGSVMSVSALDAWVRAAVATAPEDAVLVLRVDGALSREHYRVLSAPRIRAYAPGRMNVEVRVPRPLPARRGSAPAPEPPLQPLLLDL